MKTYHEIQGDGGSDVVAQVQQQHAKIREALSGVRHLLAVASGKGGVGKSTVTMALARAFRRQGRSVAILDGDVNGPCQARLAGLEVSPWIPGPGGLQMPRSREGIGVVSFGSLLPEARPLEFSSVVSGEEQTWRATREFAMLGQLLGGVEWGELDVLLFDLPPGTERTLQFAQFLGEGTTFVLVTIPSDLSRDVVARSVSALVGTGQRLLGYVENMAGYYCRDCGEIKPLFPESKTELPIPLLGRLPFEPTMAAAGGDGSESTVSGAVETLASDILESLEPKS